MVAKLVGSGVNPDNGLVFGVCNLIATQLKGQNFTVLAPETARQGFLAVFVTL